MIEVGDICISKFEHPPLELPAICVAKDKSSNGTPYPGACVFQFLTSHPNYSAGRCWSDAEVLNEHWEVIGHV